LMEPEGCHGAAVWLALIATIGIGIASETSLWAKVPTSGLGSRNQRLPAKVQPGSRPNRRYIPGGRPSRSVRRRLPARSRDLGISPEDGTVLRPSQVSSHVQSLIKKSALPRIRLHDLRHTSASTGLQAGESLKEVSSRLGHSTIVITADIYAHISPELAKESAERLARLVCGEIALDGR
jgi:hypothetical protein